MPHLVGPEHPDDVLAGGAEVALDPADLHGLDHHARQAERDLLRKLLAVHRRLEAVAEVDVQELARVAVQHEVGGVPVPEAQEVPRLRGREVQSRQSCQRTSVKGEGETI